MLGSMLLAAAVVLPLAAPPAAPTGPARFLAVKKWTITWSVQIEQHSSVSIPEAQVSSQSDVIDQASGVVTVELEGEALGENDIWEGENGTATGSYSHREEGHSLAGTAIDTHAAAGSLKGKGSLQINARQGTYSFSGGGEGDVDGTWSQSGPEGTKSGAMTRRLPSASCDFRPLPSKGLTLSGTQTDRKDEPSTMPGISGRTVRTVTSTWTISPGEVEQVELVFEPRKPAEYDKWLPLGNLTKPELPGSFISFKATFQKKGGGRPQQVPEKIRFNLKNTSREKGIALNYPKLDAKTDFDLRFYGIDATDEEQTFELEPDPSKLQWEVPLAAFDYGAFAHLRVTAVMPGGTEIIGTFKPTGADYATIPRDDDGNHISDNWERVMGVSGAPESDVTDVKPEGQDGLGDGITLYEEYRGFVHLKDMTSEKVHDRTNPRLKTLFVIDKQKLWNAADWRDATSMESFRLDGDLVSTGNDCNGKNNATSFNRGFAKGEDFDYAVRLMSESSSPGDSLLGRTFFGNMSNEAIVDAMGPRDVLWVIVYDNSIKNWVEDLAGDIEHMLENRRDLIPDGRRAQLQEAARRLRADGRVRASLQEALRRKIVVHEVGHACGVDHHGLDTGLDNFENSMAGGGALTCPSRYFKNADYLTIAMTDVLFPGPGMVLANGKYCGAATCWPALTVRDWRQP